MTSARALCEAHAHLPQHGRAMAMLDLSACGSREDLLALIDTRAKAMGISPGWILAHGARPEGWASRGWPELDDVDDASRGHKLCAWCFDHHAILANTPALQDAGISAETPDPPGGMIGRDPHARPTGVLLESASGLVWGRVPEPSPAERRAHVLGALDDLRAHGYVEVHDLKSPAWLGPLLADLDDQGLLEIPVVLHPMIDEIESEVERARSWSRDRVRLGGAKVFTDGTLNSRTAWVLDRYADPVPGHPSGTPLMPTPQIEEAVRRADALSLPLAAHAIGDGAVRAVLDAVERARPRTPGQRIEHAELIDEADVPRFAQLGVIASVQPCHLLCDIEALTRLLPHRLDRVLPLRDLIDAGCDPGALLRFGSDVPIVRPDPIDSVVAATRRGRPGSDVTIGPSQAITEREAYAAFAPS